MAPPFTILTVSAFDDMIAKIKRDNPEKHKRILKTIRLLRDLSPAYPGLNTHKYQSLAGPGGEPVWEVYVENRTPGAWRLWWIYGPDTDTITLIMVGPHP
jgi:hypothetical protein